MRSWQMKYEGTKWVYRATSSMAIGDADVLVKVLDIDNLRVLAAGYDRTKVWAETVRSVVIWD